MNRKAFENMARAHHATRVADSEAVLRKDLDAIRSVFGLLGKAVREKPVRRRNRNLSQQVAEFVKNIPGRFTVRDIVDTLETEFPVSVRTIVTILDPLVGRGCVAIVRRGIGSKATVYESLKQTEDGGAT